MKLATRKNLLLIIIFFYGSISLTFWLCWSHLACIYSLYLINVLTALPNHSFKIEILGMQASKWLDYARKAYIISITIDEHLWILGDKSPILETNRNSNDFPSDFQPTVWAIETEKSLDSVQPIGWEIFITEEMKAPTILESLAAATRVEHYVSCIHIVNIITPSTEMSEKTMPPLSPSIAYSLQQQLETNLFSARIKERNFIDISVKKYDWPMDIEANGSNIFRRNITEKVVDIFREESMFSRYDIFIVVFPFQSHAKFETVGDNIRIFSLHNEDETTTQIGGKYLISNENRETSDSDGNLLLAQFARYIIRNHILTYRLKDLFVSAPWVIDEFINETIDSLVDVDIAPMELHIEKVLRKLRVFLEIKVHFQALKESVTSHPWKMLAVSHSQVYQLQESLNIIRDITNQQIIQSMNKKYQVGENFNYDEWILQSEEFAKTSNHEENLERVSLVQLEKVLSSIIEMRSVIFVAQPTIKMLPQMMFIIYGPFWFPLLVPIFRTFSLLL